MRGDVLKGHMDLLLLAVLAEGPQHGYAVIESLRTRSGGVFQLAEGTVYPVLHRLERERLLSSTWTLESGRRRRTYQVTPAGRRALGREAQQWHVFAGAVGRLLGGEAWPETT